MKCAIPPTTAADPVVPDGRLFVVIPEGAGPVNSAGSSWLTFLVFSDAVWVNASEAWGSRIGRRPTAKRP
jgi:hypothetical protein